MSCDYSAQQKWAQWMESSIRLCISHNNRNRELPYQEPQRLGVCGLVGCTFLLEVTLLVPYSSGNCKSQQVLSKLLNTFALCSIGFLSTPVTAKLGDLQVKDER